VVSWGILPIELSDEQRAKVEALLIRHRKILSTGDYDIGCTKLVEHCIDMGDARLIRQPLRMQVFEHAKETDEMLRHGIIEQAASPWASNVVLVKKKDGSLRFCVDYRRLNAVTYKDSHLLPLIDNCLTALSGSSWYRALDFAILENASVFHRLSCRPIETSSQERGDEHENSARVAAISYGTASQNAVKFDCESEAVFLCKRLATDEKVGIGDAEVYCENSPVQLDSPTVHTVKVVTKKGDVSGLAGGESRR